jgi:epoxyqueuosine reductase
MADKTDGKGGIGRREFLKLSGAASAALSLVGVMGGGYASGKDFDTYTGWEDLLEGGDQWFDRKPFEVDKPTYEVVGSTRRPNPNTEVVFYRHRYLSSVREGTDSSPGWKPEDGIDALPDDLAAFYKEDPHKLEMDLLRQDTLAPLQKENGQKYNIRWELAMAYANAIYSVKVPSPDRPPEEWDFRDIREEPLKPKSPEKASELIKKMAHLLGATLVNITELNPDWVYADDVRGGEKGPYEVPEWWKYAIVITTPHEWDQELGNPTYGTTSDAYARSAIAAYRLATFIRRLGYPAREHTPSTNYDLMVPPIAIDAGQGQQGRFVFTITPELGSNNRSAVVTTNFPMAVDKPIDVGIHEFCNKCKICAENCPSNAISYDDEPMETIRGYKRWALDIEACYNYWGVVLGNGGCRVCLAVCPYARKNNWLHHTAREVAFRDPTGLADSGMIWMQRSFFDGPSKEEYYPPNHPQGNGVNASYRPGPDWMRIEDWFNVDVTW